MVLIMSTKNTETHTRNSTENTTCRRLSLSNPMWSSFPSHKQNSARCAANPKVDVINGALRIPLVLLLNSRWPAQHKTIEEEEGRIDEEKERKKMKRAKRKRKNWCIPWLRARE